MAFKVYSFSEDGVKSEGKYYHHMKAFTVGIDLLKTNRLVLIGETQWCTKTNKLVERCYTVKDDSVYNTEEITIPVYSTRPEFANYMEYRALVHNIYKSVKAIYSYMKVDFPYSEEFMYSLTHKELKSMEAAMLQDKTVAAFYASAKVLFNSVIEYMRINKLPVDWYSYRLIRMDPVEMVEWLKTFEKSNKNHLLKTVYGASLIDMYPL